MLYSRAWRSTYINGVKTVNQRRTRASFEIAETLQADARERGFGPTHPAPPPQSLDDPILVFDVLVTDKELRDTTRTLFKNGHYALAVEEAYKALNNLIKSRTGLAGDGAGLMTKVFSLDKPLLRLNNLRTQSQRDQQIGYAQIFAGSMTGIRNPRAHEHKYLDEPHAALELLSLANHLFRLVSKATRTRSRKVKT